MKKPNLFTLKAEYTINRKDYGEKYHFSVPKDEIELDKTFEFFKKYVWECIKRVDK